MRFLFVILFSTLLFAAQKYTIKSNGLVIKFDKQKDVDSFTKMFSEGEFYGRFRTNNFYFWWKGEDAKHTTQFVSGIGGSLIYNSAVFKGFDFGAGFYYSKAFFDEKNDPVSLIKAGKDTLSRYDYLNSGRTYLSVLGQLYIGYSYNNSNIKIGRQLVETFFTKSNDSKMVPNTFDGIVLEINDIPKTSLKLAYLTKQKLRDHSTFHPVFMYADSNYDPYAKTVSVFFKDYTPVSINTAKYSANDDSAMHRGLTYTKLKQAGIDPNSPLLTGDLHFFPNNNTKIDISFYTVYKLLSQVMAEANWDLHIKELTITPGFRYIAQIDDKAGKIGGASIFGDVNSTNPHGYNNPNSLDSYMIGARVVLRYKKYKINLAYTGVADKADLVNPFRGFPTQSYTRSMGIYNWFANNRSYRIELVRNPNSNDIYKNLFLQTSVMYLQRDKEKTRLFGDKSIYCYLGFVKNLQNLPQLQWKLRLGYMDNLNKDYKDTSYLDSRFEINYMF